MGKEKLSLTLEDAIGFKKAIDAISALVDEAEFIIDEKGFSLKATDPSQISMIDFELEKKAFKEFNVEGVVKIGLDLNYFSQIMSRARAKDSLHLSLSEDNKLMVVFKGKSTRKFSIPLIDISQNEIPSPKIEFDAKLKLNADVLQDGLKDASLISSHITIGVDENKFFMKAHSTKGTVDNDTEKKDGSIKDFDVTKEATSMFPLDYLQNMVKTASSDTPIQLEMKDNSPIRLSYAIGKAKINYFLAPRIENE